MKKLLYAIVCCTLCLSTQTGFVSSANADSVRVGFCERYGISSSPNAQEFSGYGYSYLKELAEVTGWNYTFVRCNWDDCLDKLENGEIDAFGPMQITPERAQRFLFPEEAQGFEYGALYALAGNAHLFYEDFECFNGMRVAVIPGSYFDLRFREYCKEKGFTVSFTPAKSVEEMFRLLEAGKVDAIVCGSIVETSNAKVIAKFSVAPFFLAFSKQRDDLLRDFSSGVHKLREQNIFFDAEIYRRHYQDNIVSQPVFTRPEIEYIKSAPVLTVGYDPDWKPLEFYDRHDKDYSGIVADLLQAVERNSGLRFNYVPTPTYKEALDKFQSHALNMVTLHAPLPDTRTANATHTIPLLNVPILMVAKNDTKPQRDMIIGIFSNTHFETEARNQYRDSRFVVYNSVMEGIQAVYKGDITTLLIPSYVFDEIMRDPRYSDLRPLASTRYSLPVQLAIHDPTDGQLTAVLNKAIKRLTQEEIYSSIFANTIRAHSVVSLERVLNEYAYPLILIIFFVILLSLGAVLTNKQIVEKMLRRVAYTDAKTGIANWNSMEHNGPALMSPQSAYVTLDINNFKLLNDYFGFENGDRVLAHIAESLTHFTKKNELAVRCAGDVFGMLLQVKEEQEIRERLALLTEKILTCRPVQEMDGFSLSLSYGICLNRDRTTALLTLRDRADTARKLFKNNYRTTYAFYDEEIHTHIIREREIESKMDDALKNGEFHPYYQPKYDLRNDCIVGAEALARWLSPDQGIIHPCNFIPLFERNGFIVKLDMYILEQTCRHLREWLNEGRSPVPVSVNFSKLHIMNTNFVQDVLNTVQRYCIPPRLIELELTETAFLENTELLLRVMKEFSSHGFTLSMDDFGTGYSSLNMLQELPVNVLKLDRAFLDMTNDNVRARNIIAHVVQMARDLDMRVVSEGVETVDHVRFLKGVGCDMAQGFFYSPPVPVEAFAQMTFYTLPGCRSKMSF